MRDQKISSKILRSGIIFFRHKVVTVDMEDGIEHLGRATAESIDKMLVCVETGARSPDTANAITGLGEEIGIRDFGIVGNKARDKTGPVPFLEVYRIAFFYGTIYFPKFLRSRESEVAHGI